MKKCLYLILVLLVASCKPKEEITTRTQGPEPSKEKVLRAALAVMKNEVNEYVEANQDVKMEFDSRRCLCRYFVGGDFASAEMRWTVRLSALDEATLEAIPEDGMMRVQTFTVGLTDNILFEEGELDPLNVNELNVYLNPADAESAARYIEALKTAVQVCKRK